jgi:cell division protein FtsI (penicillin-binding protein 3)
LVTISAALQEKLTRPDELFDCQMGSIVINGMRIHDAKPHGVLTVTDVLAESSDVGSVKIALRLGEDRFYNYIRAFGFGQQTGIELPGETRGMTKPVNRWSKVSIGAISIGQEIGVSAVQLAALVSTFANDGVRVAPRIVATTGAPGGAPQMITFHPQNEQRVISPMVAAQMRQMMQRVVLHGTGRRANLEGYTSAGKTGTGQKVDPATGAYSRTKYVASFAGFAPINNPAVTVAVILDSAVGPHQGGQVAAPVFQRITQQVLEYLHVSHDLELPANHQVWLAKNKVKDSDLDEASPDHLGPGLELADFSPAESVAPPTPPPATKPSPVQGPVVPAALREKEPLPAVAKSGLAAADASVKTLPTGTVVLEVEQGGIEVPSFLGKSVRGALEAAQDSGLELNPVGSGIAREQLPAAGTHVSAGSIVVVKFGR